MIERKVRIIPKKIACISLSLTIAFLCISLSSYAASEKCEGKKSYAYAGNRSPMPVKQIEPGQKFTSGVYEIDDDIVVKSKPGENGIEVEDKVKFIIKNNHTIKIVAGDGEGVVGGGAGVYVPEGSTFIVEGQGTFDVKGGDSAAGGRGSAGKDARLTWGNSAIQNGWGGLGGNGGGGAGAAIGTPGGEGGAGGFGGEGIIHDIFYMTFSNVCNGIPGNMGKEGKCSLRPGNFVLLGDIKFIARAGKANKKLVEGGEFGKDLTYIDCGWWTFGKKMYYTCTGGAGGGVGGNGYAATEVGSGGSGGGGGGGGGSGVYDTSLREDLILKGNGGGGGAGQGTIGTVNGGGKIEYNAGTFESPAKQGNDSKVVEPGRGGGGGGTNFINYHPAGCGGTGGIVAPAREGGKFYCDNDNIIKLIKKEIPKENEFIGKDSEPVKIVRSSDCKIKIKEAPKNDVYVYDGKPIKPEIEVYNSKTKRLIPKDVYEIKYFDVIGTGEASIVVHGIKHSKRDAPIIIDDDNVEICGGIKKYFTIKYGVKITGMKVKSKNYDGERVKPVGKAEFTRTDDSSIVVEDKLPIVVNYYDNKGNLLKRAPTKIGDYQYEIVVKPDVEKYIGSTGKLDFSILPRENKQ